MWGIGNSKKGSLVSVLIQRVDSAEKIFIQTEYIFVAENSFIGLFLNFYLWEWLRMLELHSEQKID